MGFININDVYKELINNLLDAPKIGNTKELLNVKFTLQNINNNIITCRNISYEYALGELVWYFSGSNDMEYISQFGSMWEKISDDGKTNNSAYGYILKRKWGFDQIEKIIELLSKDKSTRRAVLNINWANENLIETKDEPCTIALQFYIRNEKLHLTTMMRSNDIYFGLPYDAIFFTELQKYVANKLELEYGSWTHFVTSMHIYERDIKKLSNLKEDSESYSIDIEKLYQNACSLLSFTDKDNIINICKNWKILNKN